MFPAFHSGEDAAGIGGPDEGFWIGVCLGDEAIDGGFQIVHRSEDPALEAPTRECGEEALDGVEPGRRGRCEVEGPTAMSGEPLAHLGMFMGGVVIDDSVDRLSFWNLRLDGVEEADNS